MKLDDSITAHAALGVGSVKTPMYAEHGRVHQERILGQLPGRWQLDATSTREARSLEDFFMTESGGKQDTIRRGDHARGSHKCEALLWRPPSAADRLTPSCKIRLGTNCETSRVSTGKFTVTRHKNRSCKHMEDMYCDNGYIKMTPTRCSVLITSESGDELISLREQFIGRAEQHLLQHYYITERTTCTTSELVGEQHCGP